MWHVQSHCNVVQKDDKQSPARMPGVSRRVTVLSTSAGVCDASNLETRFVRCLWCKTCFFHIFVGNLMLEPIFNLTLTTSPGEESAAKLLKMSERFWSVNTQHVARRFPLFVAVAGNIILGNLDEYSPYYMEVVRSRFWTNSHAREVIF